MKLPSNSSCSPRSNESGFSLLELCVAAAVLLVVVAAAMNYVAVATQRAKAEQTKVDLSQEGREFVDEFERDLHQSGYPDAPTSTTLASTTAPPSPTTTTPTLPPA